MKNRIAYAIVASLLVGCSTPSASPPPVIGTGSAYNVSSPAATNIVRVFDSRFQTIIQFSSQPPADLAITDGRSGSVSWQLMGNYVALPGLYPSFTVKTARGSSVVTALGSRDGGAVAQSLQPSAEIAPPITVQPLASPKALTPTEPQAAPTPAAAPAPISEAPPVPKGEAEQSFFTSLAQWLGVRSAAASPAQPQSAPAPATITPSAEEPAAAAPVVETDPANQRRTWTARQGQTLEDVLSTWASEVGWQVRYLTANVYPIEFDATYTGDFRTAVREILIDAQLAPDPPRGFRRLRNKILAIYAGSDPIRRPEEEL